MNKVIFSGGVGDLVRKINESYEKGDIKGMMAMILCKNETFVVGWGNLTYLEKLGLIEAAKGDIHYQALCSNCK